MLALNAQAFQLKLQEDLSAAGAGGEDGGVVAEQGGRQIELTGGGVEAVDDVAGADGAECPGGEEEAGVVVQEVENFDRAAVGELPGCGVDLPGLVGELGHEADEGATRALLGLGRDPAWRLRMRQIVAAEGRTSTRPARW